MSPPEKEKAEIVTLPVGISGVGRPGDRIIFDPENPDPAFRVSCVRPVDITRKQEIMEAVEKAIAAQDAEKEVAS